MKYLKTFELNKNLPESDDYVIMKSYFYNDDYYNYVNNSIGQVMWFVNKKSTILVRYDNIPNDLLHMFNKTFYRRKLEYYIVFQISNIKEFSKNKADLEAYLDAKKYNL